MPLPKILIIDDDEIILSLLSEILKEQNFKVVTAKNGDKGLEMATREKPDIVILDMIMPTMNGVGVLARLRANPETQKTPVVMLTSDDKLASADAAFNEGADGYLIKPIDPVLLAEKINTLLAAI